MEWQRFPDVDVEVKLIGDHFGRALVEESNNAELIVVGSQGRCGFQGLRLGSVNQAVLQHAECPSRWSAHTDEANTTVPATAIRSRRTTRGSRAGRRWPSRLRGRPRSGSRAPGSRSRRVPVLGRG